ncbi:hypothetical protein B0O99DRAFT_616583 [Bisporella sp. PMI_857]|nr:hypothetical protein B0O99DRAFT_616583 [Bisporella sp. PMI_857]
MLPQRQNRSSANIPGVYHQQPWYYTSTRETNLIVKPPLPQIASNNESKLSKTCVRASRIVHLKPPETTPKKWAFRNRDNIINPPKIMSWHNSHFFFFSFSSRPATMRKTSRYHTMLTGTRTVQIAYSVASPANEKTLPLPPSSSIFSRAPNQ